MTSRELFAIFWIFVLFLAQNVLYGFYPLREPVFLVTGILFFALSEGPWFGALAGAAAGIFMELFGVGRMGFEMTLFAAFGAFMGFNVSKVFLESVFTKTVLPALSIYALHAVRLFFIGLFSGEAGLSLVWKALLFPESLLALLFSPLIFSCLSRAFPDPYRRRLKWPG